MDSNIHRTIVWFRRDLRLQDNPALKAALARGDDVIPAYIHCPQEEAPWQPGAASNWWLHYSLAALQKSLLEHGMRLVVRMGSSAQTLRDLIQESGASAVYWNRLYDPVPAARDQALERALGTNGVEVRSFNGSLFFEPREILNKSGQPYRVFTPFYKTLQTRVEPASGLSTVKSTRKGKINPLESIDLDDLGLPARAKWARDFEKYWSPGELGAESALESFTDNAVLDYAAGRDLPAEEKGVSRLSPHLHFGEVAPHRVWYEVEQRSREISREQAAEPYLRQLIWREFAHYLLYHFPDTSEHAFNRGFENFPWRQPDQELYPSWTQGATGIPLIDAGMRELWQSGWMHNRLRMNVASFLTKHCLIDWRVGAAWFWDTLVDADLANNSMGWQWSAGCGADAAPFFRIFNPVRQGTRFDPEGQYRRRWVPELRELGSKQIHAPWSHPQAQAEARARGYPDPVVDLSEGRARALSVFKESRQ